MNNEDAKQLEITGDGWTGPDDRTRVLLLALNVPGYYSLPVRILSLVARNDAGLSGFDCRFLEAEQQDEIEPLAAKIAGFKPRIVGLSINIWNRNESFALCRRLKELIPDLAIIVGGQEVTRSAVDYLLMEPALDYIVDGEGEIAFAQFLKAWESGNGRPDPQEVSGLHYRQAGKSCFTRPVDIVASLDEVPSAVLAGLVPAFEKDNLGVLLEGARGCPYQCAFCFEGGKKGGVRSSSFERISAEVAYMAAKGSTYFHIMDPILCNGDLARLKKLSEFFHNLRRENSRVIVLVEAYAEHITEEAARYLQAFTIIDIGLQTTNPATVKAIHRHYSEEKFMAGIRLLRSGPSKVNIYLILGLPHETPLSFLQGLDFVLSAFPIKFFVNDLCLLNGSELRHRAQEFGYVYAQNPPYSVIETPTFPRQLLKTVLQLSKDLEWRYNLSMQSLYADVPWFSQPTGRKPENFRILLKGSCTQGCAGCRTATGDIDPADVMKSLKNVTANSNVDLVVGEEPDMNLLFRVLGQLHLAGVARIRLVTPPAFFRDRPRLHEVMARGAWHMLTFFSAADSSGYSSDDLPVSFPLRKWGVIRPYYEVVVEGRALPAEQGLTLVERVNDMAFSAITVPEQFLAEGGREKYAEMFATVINKGKWLRLPEGDFRKSVLQDEELCNYIGKFGMFSNQGEQRPCFVPQETAGQP